jgi:UPF0716 family protein affecting phage T7 exclusion
MLIVWSALFGVLLFLGIVLLTLVFGAAANKAEKEDLRRLAAEREAGPTGDLTAGASYSSAAANG